MRSHRRFTGVIAVFLSIFLLANVSFAASLVAESPSPAPSEDHELPVYMQLMLYVSHLLTEGMEVPKALLNKIDAYYKSGK